MNLPNFLTVARVVAAPVIFVLILRGGFAGLLTAFVLFVSAGISDIWDGYLARRRGQITDFGKLADPIADKLLVLGTFVPFYTLSLDPASVTDPAIVPGWQVLPLWVLIVVLGREFLITLFRGFAKAKGVVIAAGKAGKYKALFQN
ncbi:MAG: CDP-alcohol phosphatidyltransferase family protein, partial [Gemmatimonadota bacterium]